MEYWEPDGRRRTSSSERDLQENLEEFFEAAKCTKYDDDIQDYVEDGSRERRRNRVKNQPLSTRTHATQDDYPHFVRHQSVLLDPRTPHNPANKVERVHGALGPPEDLLDQAEEIAQLAESRRKKKSREGDEENQGGEVISD